MTCEYCTQAQDRAYFPLFRADCKGCGVRSVAMSQTYFESMRAGRLAPEYQRLLRSALGEDIQHWHGQVKAEYERVQKVQVIL